VPLDAPLALATLAALALGRVGLEMLGDSLARTAVSVDRASRAVRRE
jgi:hypothetical protein